MANECLIADDIFFSKRPFYRLILRLPLLDMKFHELEMIDDSRICSSINILPILRLIVMRCRYKPLLISIPLSGFYYHRGEIELHEHAVS